MRVLAIPCQQERDKFENLLAPKLSGSVLNELVEQAWVNDWPVGVYDVMKP